jgi:dipeptidyl-peptidase-4
MHANLTKAIILIVLLFLETAFSQKKNITLDDISKGRTFGSNSYSELQWFNSGNKFSFIISNRESGSTDICEYDISTGNERVIVSGNDLKINTDDKPFRISNYKWSPDDNLILFTGKLPARSLKTGGAFYLFDLRNMKFSLLVGSENEQSNVQFSPDSKMIGFVRENNLFVLDIQTLKEKQLTFDGSVNIINGQFDWAYEEEFSIISGWEWSPDSKSIAYWRLDQSNVPDINLAKWDSLYLNSNNQKYPKPGAKNSIVKIGVVEVESGKNTWMDIGSEPDIYIPRIKFTANPELLTIQRLNRLQNNLDLLLCDVKTGKSKVIINEKSMQWVDIFDDLTFLKDKRKFIWSSEVSGYKHLYIFNYEGEKINVITQGNWEVGELKGVDEENEIIYYTSNERGTIYSDLYSVKFDGTDKKRITQEAGSHSIDMTDNPKYFIDRYSNANYPSSAVMKKMNGETVKELSKANLEALETFNRSDVEFFTIKTSDNVDLDAFIIKPNFLEEGKKYPVYITQYNGPTSKAVSDKWGTGGMFEQYLVQNGFIVVGVDCRITGGRGVEHKKYAYKNLGYWEVSDMIETAKYLGALPYVDSKRIGIFGSSYGGYSSAFALLKAPEYFKAAIDAFGVTDWRFYDDIYTERYMSTPELNPDGYEESSCLNFTNNLKGNLLIIHGTADDNVHFQNAIKLVESLIESRKQFQLMIYPERGHGIRGKNASYHYYQTMIDFLIKYVKEDNYLNIQ